MAPPPRDRPTRLCLPLPRGHPPLRIASNRVAVQADSTVAEASARLFEAGEDVGTWTGSVLWDAGEVLARYLTTLPAPFWPRARCVELGCGAGLVGLTAVALGAAHCRITDQAVHLARWNADQNFSGQQRGRAVLTALRWGDADAIAGVKSSGPFDLVLGADILYDRASHGALAETIAALCTQHTVLLLSTQDGAPADPEALAAPFWRKLSALGFRCEDVSGDEAVAELIAQYDGHPVADYWTSGNRGPISLVRAARRPPAAPRL